MNEQKTPRSRYVLMLGHVAGMIDLVALPLWVGTLVQHVGLDFEHAGMTVTLFLLGVVIASLVCFDRLPQRPLAVGGYLLSAAAFYAIAQSTDGPALLGLHALAGVGAGCGLSMVHGAMGRSANPHRMFALAGTALGVIGSSFFVIVPQVMARVGAHSLFLVIAGMMACASLVSLAFPAVKRVAPVVTAAAMPTGRIPRPAWLMVAGIVCLTLNQAIIFSFFERIGASRGFAASQVNGVFAAIGLVNLFPAVLAAMLQHRLPAIGVAMSAAAIQAVLALTISGSEAFLPFALAASLYAAVIIFAHTFLFGLIARLDPTGRTTALTPAMLMVGSAIGPALAGLIAQRLGFAGLGYTVAIVAVASIACFKLLGAQLKRNAPHAQGIEATVPAAK